MATITAPTAKEVFDHANVTPGSLGKQNEDEAIKEIGRTILPDVVGRVEVELDDAVGDLDFPLTDALIAAARPLWTTQQCAERIANQQAMVHAAILDLAAARVHLQVRRSAAASNSDSAGSKARDLKQSGEASLAGAIKSVRYIVERLPGGRTVDRSTYDFSTAPHAGEANKLSIDNCLIN